MTKKKIAIKKKASSTKKATDSIKAHSKEDPEEIRVIANPGNFDSIVSTGSTLLDLAISGGRVRGGGIPGGILVEVYGPPSGGKTAILAEMCADAQIKKGNVKFLDPEGRLDLEYMRIYQMELDKKDYHMPDTVNEMFAHILSWKPKTLPKGATNVIATDSLAALSSELELSDKGDKRGQKIAKDFSAGLRKTCRIIKNTNMLLACSNQVRQGDVGEVTSGGKGIPFYASLRIRIGPPAKDKYIKREVTLNTKKHTIILGVQSICTVKKSTVDNPYRTAPIYIVFGTGIDDIRGNLIHNKHVTGTDKYIIEGQEFGTINNAIKFVEDNDLELILKNLTIDLWEELQEKLTIKRKPKKRGL